MKKKERGLTLGARLASDRKECIWGFVFVWGVHAPGLGSQGRERAFNMHTFPPNTHTCLILVLMMVYSKCTPFLLLGSEKSLQHERKNQ